ncbi:hypothetical protein FISHEDRAFT_75698 [Fistulina hepatica ATCC 64428]|uniref:SCP domain-containing protein n=1 Tax=Fistulina hepatica ATCC 64428 TaxID=1128425 RepID=A0A0D7A8X2_9AGAR|nr:hypothetical protein FISHEDRAFT_75698 [Fistulina hepatica ATCC 64428]
MASLEGLDEGEYQHNIHRASHSASDLVWDFAMVSIAQESERLAFTNTTLRWEEADTARILKLDGSGSRHVTASVGCLLVLCDDLENLGSNSSFTVCNFHPAGNYAGEYADNVGEPCGDAMVVVVVVMIRVFDRSPLDGTGSLLIAN